MDSAERFLYTALAGLVTAFMRETGGEDNGPVERANDFQSADGARIAGQFVAAVGAQNGGEQALPGQRL